MLVNEIQIAGRKEAVWDRTNNNGQAVSSGIYFYKLNIGNKLFTKNLIVL